MRIALDGLARAPLRLHMDGDAVQQVLDRTWIFYPVHLARVADSSSLGIGPALVLRLAACTAALYDVLIERGQTREVSIQIASEVGWAVYRRMGQIPWVLSRFVSRDPMTRLRLATTMFRQFPFGPTAYDWEDRPAPDGTVAFDCLRCPVASFFSEAKLDDLCVSTFCALDFPLAAEWGAELHRTSSIAAGARHCDFKWQTTTAQIRREEGRRAAH